jgi:hypothetical protein
MSALTPRDPLPGHPLIYRIDTRNGRDTVFWCRVRQAFLPKSKSHAFWVSDDPAALGQFGEDPCVTLPRSLMLQYAPEFVRLSTKEREQIRRRQIQRDKTFVRDSTVTQSLKTARLIDGSRLTTLGWNSFLLS